MGVSLTTMERTAKPRDKRKGPKGEDRELGSRGLDGATARVAATEPARRSQRVARVNQLDQRRLPGASFFVFLDSQTDPYFPPARKRTWLRTESCTACRCPRRVPLLRLSWALEPYCGRKDYECLRGAEFVAKPARRGLQHSLEGHQSHLS